MMTGIPLTLTFPMLQLVMGVSHGVVLFAGGAIATWGAGQHGQLGHGIKADLVAPRVVGALREARHTHFRGTYLLPSWYPHRAAPLVRV